MTTWSTTDSSGPVLSNGNLTVSFDGGNGGAGGGVRATTSTSGGKSYFEVTINTLGDAMSIGISNSSYGLSFAWLGRFDTNSAGLRGSGTETLIWYSTGTSTPSGVGPLAVGAVIMVAYTSTKAWFGRNGNWFGDPGAGTGGITHGITNPIFPTVGSSAGSATANFAGPTMAYRPPNGFSLLDSQTVNFGGYKAIHRRIITPVGY